MRRATPEFLLRTGQPQSTEVLDRLLRSYGFEEVKGARADSGTSHIRYQHTRFSDLIVGFLDKTDVIYYQRDVAKACLEAEARLEALARKPASTGPQIKLPDDITLFETASRTYARSKKWPQLGFEILKDTEQKDIDDKHAKILRAEEEAFSKLMGELQTDYEFTFTQGDDGTLTIKHVVYPIEETLPPHGAPYYAMGPADHLKSLIDITKSFDRIFRQNIRQKYANNAAQKEGYDLVSRDLGNNLLEHELVAKQGVSIITTQVKGADKYTETPGGRTVPEKELERLNIIKNAPADENEIIGMYKGFGITAILTNDGWIEFSHPYVQGIERRPTRELAIGKIIEIVGKLPSVGADESVFEAFGRDITAYLREYDAPLNAGAMVKAVKTGIITDANIKNMNDLFAAIEKQGYTRSVTKDARDSVDVTVRFELRDKNPVIPQDRHVLEVRSMLLPVRDTSKDRFGRTVVKNMEIVAPHHAMRVQLADFLKRINQPLPSQSVNRTAAVIIDPAGSVERAMDEFLSAQKGKPTTPAKSGGLPGLPGGAPMPQMPKPTKKKKDKGPKPKS